MLCVCPLQEDCVVVVVCFTVKHMRLCSVSNTAVSISAAVSVSHTPVGVKRTLILTAGGLITQITNTQGLTDQTEKTASRQRDTLMGLIEFS